MTAIDLPDPAIPAYNTSFVPEATAACTFASMTPEGPRAFQSPEEVPEPPALLQRERIINLAAEDKSKAIKELVDLLARHPAVTDSDELFRAVQQRERDMSTAMGCGCAMPHAKVASVRDFIMAVGLSRKGIPFEADDGTPAHIVVLIAGPLSGPFEGQRRYLKILGQVSAVLADDARREGILTAMTADAVYEAFKDVR